METGNSRTELHVNREGGESQAVDLQMVCRCESANADEVGGSFECQSLDRHWKHWKYMSVDKSISSENDMHKK